MIKTSRLLATVALTILTGCQVSGKRQALDQDGPKAASESMQVYSGDFEEKKVTFSDPSGSEETLWALSHCDCQPRKLQAYFESLAGGRGVLPQILMPSVREEIKNNETLANLQKLPLGGVLAGLFTTDEKLAKSVAEGLGEKLKNSPGGSDIGKRWGLRFDGFRPLKGQKNSFKFSDQIVRWHNVFSANGMWKGETPIDGLDHGLQSLELLRTLAEWSYMIGIDKNSSGGFYGGLTVSAKEGALGLNGPVDPRSKVQPAWFLSGTYNLTYADESAKDLATSVKEKWSRDRDLSVTLDEQARFWHTAAVAFKRLRPESRKQISSLFVGDKKGVLPEEAHELPLAFLTSLKTLLPGPFIDKDTRLVRAKAAFISDASNQEADVMALARLARALVAWIVELRTISKDTVSAATFVKVQHAAEDLLPPLQVAVQTILQKHSLQSSDLGGTYGLALVANHKKLGIVESSEVLLALMEAESLVVESDFLKARISSILDWYGGDLLTQVTSMSTEELIWLRTLSAAASEYSNNDEKWITSALSFADRKLGEAP